MSNEKQTGSKTGLVGVGLMGHGIALNILNKGWKLDFLNHAGNQPVDDLLEAGATSHSTLESMAAACDTIILCVTGSPQVESILLEEGALLSTIKPASTLIDCSTAAPDSTRQLAIEAEKAGVHFIDAPMTRTPKEAAVGRLNLLVGGDAAIVNQQLPLLQTFAENITHVGPVGSGHAMKLIHNYVSLGFSAVLAEASATASRAGINSTELLHVLSTGGGKSVVLDRISPYLTDKDTSGLEFTLANSLKDIGYYTSMCNNIGATSNIAGAIKDTYKGAVDDGKGDQFVPILIDLLANP